MSSASVFAEQLASTDPFEFGSSTQAATETQWKPRRGGAALTEGRSVEPTGLGQRAWIVTRNTTQAVDVTILARRSEWLVAALRALSRFSALHKDWDSYGADAPSGHAIDAGRKVLQLLEELDFQPTSVDPSAEGGICISFASANRYADIECFNTGEILAVTSKAGDDPGAWRVGSDDIGIRGTLAAIKSFIRHDYVASPA